ncbi:MAG: cupin domain-containing protein [Candidatus Saccharibacteria bacterium]
MTGYIVDLEKKTLSNENFREVLYTAKNSQLVVMTIQPGEDIGVEAHEGHDQFIRVEAGTAKALLNGEEHELTDGFAVVIPAGTEHNIINTGTDKLKLYTLYTPPEHPDGTIHATKSDALNASLEH